MNVNPAVFLDRDGTINELIPYLGDHNKFNFLPKAKKALSLLQSNGFKLIIVTNQSGIGRGFFSLTDLEKVHKKMALLLANNSIIIDGIYYCPHVPEDKCECRKPKLKMLEKARKELHIDINKSYFIGDSLSDILAGSKFGCKTILVKTGNGQRDLQLLREKNIIPDLIANTINEAAKWIIDMNNINDNCNTLSPDNEAKL